MAWQVAQKEAAEARKEKKREKAQRRATKQKEINWRVRAGERWSNMEEEL